MTSSEAKTSLPLQDIYTALFEGNTLTIQFSSISELDTLKSSLFRYKKITEDMLVDLGAMQESDIKSLSILPCVEPGEGIIAAEFSFKKRTAPKTYTILKTVPQTSPAQES